MTTLADLALGVLLAADPAEKCRLTRAAAESWASGSLDWGHALPPELPARPARPELLPPNKMPKRAYKGPAGRIGLYHALAHIELNAIDLAWDILLRFPDAGLPRAFADDWVQVALDEAVHFEMLEGLLAPLGAAYGDLPAHNGLWDAALKTRHSLYARLAVVPMTLEARGLDTTPQTIQRLSRNGETDAVEPLTVIFEDEIKHVAAGARWFGWLCQRDGKDPAREFAGQLAEHFPGGLKLPFNVEARGRAGFPHDWYGPLGR